MNQEITEHIKEHEIIGLDGLEDYLREYFDSKKEDIKQIISVGSNASTSITGKDHSKLSHLDYTTSGHTGFETTTNKSTDVNLGVSDTLYPTQNAVKTYVDNAVSAENLWDRTGTTLSPHTAGDSIDVASAKVSYSVSKYATLATDSNGSFLGQVNGVTGLQIGASNTTYILPTSAGSQTLLFGIYNTAKTGATYQEMLNAGGDFFYGVESSTGGYLVTGSTAYSAVMSMASNVPMHFGTNNTIRMTIEADGDVDFAANDLLTTGSIGATGSRVLKGWFTDLEVTNTISGSITGNSATATKLLNARTIGGVSFDGSANITVASATGGFAISGGALTMGSQDITGVGSIGTTGARVTKGWFTDLEVTNAIAGSITGNAATLTVADTTSATCYVGLYESASGSLAGKTDGGLLYNASTVSLGIGVTPTYQLETSKTMKAGTAIYSNTRALSFDGSNDYITMGELTELNGVATFSISCWVNQRVLDAADYIFYKLLGATGDYHQVALFASSGYMYALVQNGSNSWGRFDYSTKFSANRYHHILMTYNGGGATNADKVKLYIDNELITLTYNGTLPATTYDMTGATCRIGHSSSSWDGYIKDLRIYSEEVSQANGLIIYQGGTYTTNMVHQFKLMEGSGTTATDTGSNPINGTISGATWSTDGNVGIGTDFGRGALTLAPYQTTAPYGLWFGYENPMYRCGSNEVAADFKLALADGVTSPTTSTYGLTFGGATAGTPDVNLYRSAADMLKTDDSLTVAGDASVFGSFTMTEAKNIALGTTTGTKIGTATDQKLGIYGKTPVVQQTALTTQLTTITASDPGTPDYAIADLTQTSPYGFVSADEGQSLLKVIANLQTRLAELETRLSTYGWLP